MLSKLMLSGLVLGGFSLGSAAAQTLPSVANPSSSAPSAAPINSDAPEFPYPKRKAGLWEVKIAGGQQAGLPATQLCVGENTDSASVALDRKASVKGSCKTGPFTRVGNGWLLESICKEGKVNITSRSLASGDFTTEYRIDTFVSYVPPLASGKREDKDALVGQWLGECRPGQKIGDMFVPGMGSLNMVDGSVRPIAEPRAKKRR